MAILSFLLTKTTHKKADDYKSPAFCSQKLDNMRNKKSHLTFITFFEDDDIRSKIIF